MRAPHTFGGNPLDRADALRRNPDWLSTAEASEHSRYLPLWRLNVALDASGQLGWMEAGAARLLLDDEPPVFLGLAEGVAHFAFDVSHLGDEQPQLGEGLRFSESRAAAMHLPVAETGILAQARAQVGWHRSHRFCSRCGGLSRPKRGGHVRKCDACGAEHFPRTDPVAIMAITDGERCLLGQSKGPLVRTGMYSALAGFVDQGESIEEAVRREVLEEAGIEVGEVRYHSSQPWPFPSSLMIGCLGLATTTEIEIDSDEMEDVSWFEKPLVKAALEEPQPQLRLPGAMAIAHHLIRAWVEDEIEF